ncbi:hypothetical protein [Duganella sp. Root1480D1]|uniref:hypothetical protein n=1 Tax=Duganella sp. Root1480D1 TaxID=1736471 RepID=UPI00070F2A36|nr:hypothetical protein [Duganella sp. Root1480D1]KQZ44209.1 hypothetical protein ASD58_18540 [Duganella sp. Root1480D1]
MFKLLATFAFLAMTSLAFAAEFTIVTGKGYVRFTVPDQWAVLSMQTKPPVSVAAFQVANPADEGTPHSSNVAVSLFHVDAERGQTAASAIGKQFGALPPTVSTLEGWTIYTQQASQQGTAYTIIDAKKPFADVVVGLRFAWPHLAANPAGYDQSMNGAFESLRRSVSSGFGVPASRPGEVIRRPEH